MLSDQLRFCNSHDLRKQEDPQENDRKLQPEHAEAWTTGANGNQRTALAACAGPVFFRIFGFSFKENRLQLGRKQHASECWIRSQLQMSQQVKTELSSLHERHSPEAPLGVPKTGQGDFRIMATLSKSHGIIPKKKT